MNVNIAAFLFGISPRWKIAFITVSNRVRWRYKSQLSFMVLLTLAAAAEGKRMCLSFYEELKDISANITQFLLTNRPSEASFFKTQNLELLSTSFAVEHTFFGGESSLFFFREIACIIKTLIIQKWTVRRHQGSPKMSQWLLGTVVITELIRLL